MKRITFTAILLLIFVSINSAQNLKKGFKAFNNGKYEEAETIFKSIPPKQVAAEYGLALLYNKDYRYNLTRAFGHIKSSDSLMIRYKRFEIEGLKTIVPKEKLQL